MLLCAVDASSGTASRVFSSLFQEIVKFAAEQFVKQLVQNSGSTNGISDSSDHQQKLDDMERLVPGYRQTAEALARCARDEQDARELGTALANQVIYMLRRKGVTRGRLLACRECFDPVLLGEEDMSIYSDRAAVRLAMRSLLSGRRPNGEKIPYISTDRGRRATMNTIVRVLDDALAQVRSHSPVDRDSFEKAIIDASRQSAIKASRKRHWIKSVSPLDQSGRTLIFEITEDNKYPFVDFDVGLYSTRLKHLLAFSSDADGSIPTLLSPNDNSDDAEKARTRKGLELMEECENLSPSPTFHILPDRPPQCGGGLRIDDMKVVNKEFLLARIRDTCSF